MKWYIVLEWFAILEQFRQEDEKTVIVCLVIFCFVHNLLEQFVDNLWLFLTIEQTDEGHFGRFVVIDGSAEGYLDTQYLLKLFDFGNKPNFITGHIATDVAKNLANEGFARIVPIFLGQQTSTVFDDVRHIVVKIIFIFEFESVRCRMWLFF